MGAIATVNMVYQGIGPTVTNEVLASYASAPGAQDLQGICTAVGESGGADTDFTVNWIDGTAVLPFTPTAVFAHRNGGTAAATISVVGVASITATSALVTLSAAPASAATAVIAIRIMK